MVLFTMSRSILHVSLPKPEHRAGAFTIAAIVSFTGMSLTSLMGGMLSDAFGYRTTFIICAIGGIIIYSCVYVGGKQPSR